MKSSLSRGSTLASLLAVLLLPLAALAASPRSELLRLVPDDVAFCLVVQDLRGHFAALRDSPFVEAFPRSSLGVALGHAQETEKLWAVQEQLQKALQLDWNSLRDDVFGDAVVLAYRPGPVGQVKQDQDLLLLRARDAEILRKLVERLNQLQRERKEVKDVDEREHEGQKYFCRRESDHDSFYYLHGPVLAVSSREEMIQQVIDRERSTSGEPAVARELRLLGVEQRLAALWINPRRFDADMEQKAAQAQGPEAVARKTFLTCWKGLDGVALTFDVQKDVELALVLRGNPAKLPLPAQQLLARAARPSDLWNHFPENSLLVLTGSTDVPALLDLVGEFQTPSNREALWQTLQGRLGAALGKDVARDVLPCIGPDWGLCVAAAPSGARDWFPHVLLAVRVQAGDRGAPVDQGLLGLLNSYALLGIFSYNSQHRDQVSLHTVTQDKVEVKYLVNDSNFPPGLSPAFALVNGYLVLASSPEALRRLGPGARMGPPSAPPEELPLLRLSLRELRRFVQERREVLARAVAEKNQIKPEEADRRLGNLFMGLELFDRIELTQRPGPDRVTLTLHLQTSQPLGK